MRRIAAGMTYIEGLPPALVWLFTAVVTILLVVGVLAVIHASVSRRFGQASVLAMTTVAILLAGLFLVGPAVFTPVDDRRAAEARDAYGIPADADTVRAWAYPESAPDTPRVYGTARVLIGGNERDIVLTYTGHALHLVDTETGVELPREPARP